MKKIAEEFIPFQHKNLPLIAESLGLARRQKQDGRLDGVMAASLIYTNLIEYLASNLLENLEHMTSLLAYRSFGGVFFPRLKEDDRPDSPRTLGQLIQLLRKYEFPDSTDFVSVLEKFNKNRNKIFHKLLNLPKQPDQAQVDIQFSQLHDQAEDIVVKYNHITRGVSIVWNETIRPSGASSTVTIDELQKQIEALLQQLKSLQYGDTHTDK